MEIIEHIFDLAVECAVLFFEVVGAAILIITGIKGIITYVKRDPLVKLRLAEGFAEALEFLLCGEILRTIIAHDISSLIAVGATVVLRIALTFLIHWEIKSEKEEQMIEEEHK